MLGKRSHHRSAGIALLVVLGLLVVAPTQAAEAPPAELNYVCVDAQQDVWYAADANQCAKKEVLRTLPDDRPITWCADHLGRLKELAACGPRDRQITIPDDGPIFVCAGNVRGGTTLLRGELRTVLDVSECDFDETGMVTPAAPEGVADLYTIDEDTRLVVPAKGVLDNDIDLTGEPLIAHLVDTTSQGALEFDTDGSFAFDPRGVFEHLDVGESATTSFSYRADDGALTSEVTTVTIRVVGRNDRPLAAPDLFVTDEDTALQVSPSGVLTNDTDAEGHPLTAVLVSQPPKGSVDLNATGGLRFEPGQAFQHLGATPGDSETVSFRYVARDGTADSDETTVDVRVMGINDAPVGAADQFETDENTALEIDPADLLANDTDVEGQELAATGVSIVALGNGTLTPLANGHYLYDPDADSADADGDPDLDHLASGETAAVTLTYVATDSLGLGSAPVTVTITVRGISTPTANDDVRSTDEDHAVTLDVLANDQVRGGSLTIDSSGTDGQVVLEHDGVVRYDPTGAFDHLGAGATETDTFDYTLTNDEGSSTGTVSIQVTGINDAPRALDDSYQVVPGQVLQLPPPGVLANDEDVDNVQADLESVLVAPPDKGRLTLRPDGGFSFDPSGEFQGGGSTSFRYRADDGRDESSTATVTLQVTPNDPPSFQGDPYSFTAVITDPAGTSLGNVEATDPDGDPLTYSVADADTDAFDLDPATGELTIGAGGPPVVGDYTLLVDVTDGKGGTDRATVTVHVVPELNAVDDEYVAVGNTPLVGYAGTPPARTPGQAEVRVAGVLANDGGDTGQVVVQDDLATAQGGQVDLAEDGSFAYRPPVPDPSSAGAWDGQSPLTDTFEYTIEGGAVADPTGVVTVTVLPAVWYADNAAAAGGNGTAWAPFDALADVSGSTGPDLAGQTIFLFGHADDPDTPGDESAYPGGIELEDQQQLVGQGAGLSVDNGSQQVLVALTGPAPTVTGPLSGTAITLAQDNSLRGLNVGGDGQGIVGSDVGALTAVVPAVRPLDDPLVLTGTDAVSVDIGSVTAGDATLLLLDGLGGNVAIDSIERSGSGGVAATVDGVTGTVQIGDAVLGDAAFTATGLPTTAQVTVGTLSGDGASSGLFVTDNEGSVSVGDVQIAHAEGTSVGITNTDGMTLVGGGQVTGTPDLAAPLMVVDGGTNGTVHAGLTLRADGTSPCDAVLVEGVDTAGLVEIGRVVGTGCGIRVEGATDSVDGTVRFVGGMDIQTIGAPAFRATAITGSGQLEVLNTVAGSKLTSSESTVLVMEQVRVGASGIRLNQASATFEPGFVADSVGIVLTDVVTVGGPGLSLLGGTITTPDRAGAVVSGSLLVNLRGLQVNRSATDGIVVRDSQGVTLDGVFIQQPDGIGIDAGDSSATLIEDANIVATGSYGIRVDELDGTTTIRGSNVQDGRDTQLFVEDGTTPASAEDKLVIESSVFQGGEPEDDSMVVLAGMDAGATTPSNLRFEVSGDTPTGTIGGDTGLLARATDGAALDVALSRFVVADTAADAVAMSAEGTGSTLDFALNRINNANGGGIQLVGGVGVRVDAVNGGVASGSMNEVTITSATRSGVVLDNVTDTTLDLVTVQSTQQHGLEVVDSSNVTLDQIDVTSPRRHGLTVFNSENVVVDDSRFDLRPAPSVPPNASEDDMPHWSSIRIQHLGGTANAVTDTTMRGSTGDQLTVLEGAVEGSVPAGAPTQATIQLSGLTAIDTAPDPVIGRDSGSPPVPDANAVSVRAGAGADLTVDLNGSKSSVDETFLLQAEGGALSVSGGHQVEQVSRDTEGERQGSSDQPGIIDRFEADPGVALISTGAGSTLELALDSLAVSQTKASAGTPLPGSPVWIQATGSGTLTGSLTNLSASMTVPDGSTTSEPSVAVEARDDGTVNGLQFLGGTIAALGGPAIDLDTEASPPIPQPFPLPPITFEPGDIDDVLIDGVSVASGLGHGFSVTDVECLDLRDNNASSVDGTGFVLNDVDLVGYDPLTTTVTQWLTANGNVGPPAPRFVTASDIGVCS